MTLPKGWIPNTPAPETLLPAYTGDPTPNWLNASRATKGIQPKSDLNPNGDTPGVPVMGMTAEDWSALSGPQES